MLQYIFSAVLNCTIYREKYALFLRVFLCSLVSPKLSEKIHCFDRCMACETFTKRAIKKTKSRFENVGANSVNGENFVELSGKFKEEAWRVWPSCGAY